jgi:hypothetical protein
MTDSGRNERERRMRKRGRRRKRKIEGGVGRRKMGMTTTMTTTRSRPWVESKRGERLTCGASERVRVQVSRRRGRISWRTVVRSRWCRGKMQTRSRAQGMVCRHPTLGFGVDGGGATIGAHCRREATRRTSQR